MRRKSVAAVSAAVATEADFFQQPPWITTYHVAARHCPDAAMAASTIAKNLSLANSIQIKLRWQQNKENDWSAIRVPVGNFSPVIITHGFSSRLLLVRCVCITHLLLAKLDHPQPPTPPQEQTAGRGVDGSSCGLFEKRGGMPPVLEKDHA